METKSEIRHNEGENEMKLPLKQVHCFQLF